MIDDVPPFAAERGMFTSVVLAVAVTAGIAAGVFINPESLAPVRWAAAMFGLLAMTSAPPAPG